MSSKIALVTGSSRGIGAATAQKLADQGWTIILHASKESSFDSSFVAGFGNSCAGTLALDLSDPDEGKSLAEKALALGATSFVINAGVYTPLPWLCESDEEFERVAMDTFHVNFWAPVVTMRHAAKALAKQGGGKIVNVASRVGFRGEPGAAFYAASKAGIINLTRSLAVELAPKNIFVAGVAPGWVDTAMAREGMDDRLPEILAGIPLGRMATPEDCAAAISFLLSDEAAYLSGVVIDINGASYFH